MESHASYGATSVLEQQKNESDAYNLHLQTLSCLSLAWARPPTVLVPRRPRCTLAAARQATSLHVLAPYLPAAHRSAATNPLEITASRGPPRSRLEWCLPVRETIVKSFLQGYHARNTSRPLTSASTERCASNPTGGGTLARCGDERRRTKGTPWGDGDCDGERGERREREPRGHVFLSGCLSTARANRDRGIDIAWLRV